MNLLLGLMVLYSVAPEADHGVGAWCVRGMCGRMMESTWYGYEMETEQMLGCVVHDP